MLPNIGTGSCVLRHNHELAMFCFKQDSKIETVSLTIEIFQDRKGDPRQTTRTLIGYLNFTTIHFNTYIDLLLMSSVQYIGFHHQHPRHTQ